jgi:hypothetical protein
MTLYLTCGLCGRKQADGLLSRGAWGHLDVAGGGTLRACPTCKTSNDDWQSQLTAGTNGAAPAVGENVYGIAR